MEISREKDPVGNPHADLQVTKLGIPDGLAVVMSKNRKSLRIAEHNKLGTKPRWFSKNKVTRAAYRNRAFKYNVLVNTSQDKLKDLKKELKKFMSR